MHPFISAFGQAVYLVWNDNRDVNCDVYYKLNPTNSDVGLNDMTASDLQFSISPNPARTEIKVRSLENINDLTIPDMFGKEVYHSVDLIPNPEFIIPTADFSAGIYFIKVRKGKKISVQKFIKQ